MALIPPNFLKTVVGIGVGDDPSDRVWVGTGFLYGLYESKADETYNNYIVFLITNEHVLRGKKKVWLRFNDTTGKGSKDIPIILIAKNGKKLWSQHSQSDVAAFFINVNILQKEGLSFHFFRSDIDTARTKDLQSQGTFEGDGVFLLGYPLGLIGGNRQYAICRTGCIARIQDLYEGSNITLLIDAFVFPGNSGGPVLKQPELISIKGTKNNPRCLLIGLVSSYVPYQDIAISNQTQRPRIIFEENTGLTNVIPVDYIEKTTKNAKRRLKNRIASARWRAKQKDADA